MNFARAARATFALILVALAGAAGAVRSGTDGRPGWTEVSWPFLLDEWGTGQAFRCEDERCGREARLLVRVKRGFCNCFQGVADDGEVDRLTDFTFLGGPARPSGPGRPVSLGDMAGRVRAFAVDNTQATSRRAVSLVLAKNCDALVVTWISEGAAAAASDSRVADWLPRTILANLP
jgi:hypothetical protein